MEIIESVAAPRTVRTGNRHRLRKIRLREIDASLRNRPHSELRRQLAEFIYMAERVEGKADPQRRTIQ